MTVTSLFSYNGYMIKKTEKIMSVQTIKQEMMKMTQSELSHIIQLAQQIKQISATATFSVGQEVFVVQKTKKTPGIIEKMNPKKAVVRMNYGSRGVVPVSVPYSMMEAA